MTASALLWLVIHMRPLLAGTERTLNGGERDAVFNTSSNAKTSVSSLLALTDSESDGQLRDAHCEERERCVSSTTRLYTDALLWILYGR
jgi:hypothetical protein